jgi:hypothetical protein
MQHPLPSRDKAVPQPLISDAELAQLLTPQERKLLKGADTGFKLRNRFLLLLALFFIIKLLLFPEQTSRHLNIPTELRDLRPYLQYRGLFIVFVTTVYYFSYVRDWHFSRISLVLCTVGCTGLVMDFFNVYSWIRGPIAPMVLAFILLRLAGNYCLLMNALRADRAPPMPRSFWG